MQCLQKYSHPVNVSTFSHIAITNVIVFSWDFWVIDQKKVFHAHELEEKKNDV